MELLNRKKGVIKMFEKLKQIGKKLGKLEIEYSRDRSEKSAINFDYRQISISLGKWNVCLDIIKGVKGTGVKMIFHKHIFGFLRIFLFPLKDIGAEFENF